MMTRLSVTYVELEKVTRCICSTHSRVELATRDSVENPNIDKKAEAIAETDKDNSLSAVASVGVELAGMLHSHQMGSKGVKEEECCADEFARRGDDVASDDRPSTTFVRCILNRLSITTDRVSSSIMRSGAGLCCHHRFNRASTSTALQGSQISTLLAGLHNVVPANVSVFNTKAYNKG